MCGVALCIAAAACANLPLSKDEASRTAARKPGGETAAPAMAQDDAAADDRGNLGSPLPDAPVQGGGRREQLTCFTGNEDRHARIGVELVNERVTYFAYYSKWRPRTCSIEAGRGDSRVRWTDNGAYHTVTLPGQRGKLRIERKGGAYRFVFVDVDRVRYCGMQGKINGSLTVMRGNSTCVVQGIMDGHAS